MSLSKMPGETDHRASPVLQFSRNSGRKKRGALLLELP
jgi:hypothetical protein